MRPLRARAKPLRASRKGLRKLFKKLGVSDGRERGESRCRMAASSPAREGAILSLAAREEAISLLAEDLRTERAALKEDRERLRSLDTELLHVMGEAHAEKEADHGIQEAIEVRKRAIRQQLRESARAECHERDRMSSQIAALTAELQSQERAHNVLSSEVEKLEIQLEMARQHTSALLLEVKKAKDQVADAQSEFLGLTALVSLLTLQRDEARFLQEQRTRKLEEVATIRVSLSDEIRALMSQEQKSTGLLQQLQLEQKEAVCKEEKRCRALKEGLALLSDQVSQDVHFCCCQRRANIEFAASLAVQTDATFNAKTPAGQWAGQPAAMQQPKENTLQQRMQKLSGSDDW